MLHFCVNYWQAVQASETWRSTAICCPSVTLPVPDRLIFANDDIQRYDHSYWSLIINPQGLSLMNYVHILMIYHKMLKMSNMMPAPHIAQLSINGGRTWSTWRFLPRLWPTTRVWCRKVISRSLTYHCKNAWDDLTIAIADKPRDAFVQTAFAYVIRKWSWTVLSVERISSTGRAKNFVPKEFC